MKKYIDIIKKSSLFVDITEEEINSMLACLNARIKTYKKGEYIYVSGDVITNISIVLDGSLHVQSDDYWGNRSIISHLAKGDIFGEAYVAPTSGAFLSDVIAVEDSVICNLDASKVLTSCSSACTFHTKLIKNLFYVISSKNRTLVQKLGHVTKRSTREKLISYLSFQAKKHNSNQFFIPFNRQQLADFLSVDRSAMSNELCKMRDEGLLSFHKNHFVLRKGSTAPFV